MLCSSCFFTTLLLRMAFKAFRTSALHARSTFVPFLAEVSIEPRKLFFFARSSATSSSMHTLPSTSLKSHLLPIAKSNTCDKCLHCLCTARNRLSLLLWLGTIPMRMHGIGLPSSSLTFLSMSAFHLTTTNTTIQAFEGTRKCHAMCYLAAFSRVFGLVTSYTTIAALAFM